MKYFGGTPDFIGGKLSVLYDEQGNATRGRSDAIKIAHEVWSKAAGQAAQSAVKSHKNR